MNFDLKPYEISVWEDRLTFVYTLNGQQIESDVFPNEVDSGTSVEQYYKEIKLGTIGSNEMDVPIRAMEPNFIENVNGTASLSFKVYYNYYDEEDGVKKPNPWNSKIVNERKIKLKYGEEWYDFIIKTVVEDSASETLTVTAKNLFINELSKNGFSIELNEELNNNQDTVNRLAERILEGTDWEVDSDGTEILPQFVEEPLYAITLSESITGIKMRTDPIQEIEIAAGQVIYGFYSCIANQKQFFQFLYRSATDYEVNDDKIIINSDNYQIDNCQYSVVNGINIPDFASEIEFSDSYRGRRLVREQLKKWNSKLEKFVYNYIDGINLVNGFTETEYITPVILNNYITNNKNFTSRAGWEAGKRGGVYASEIDLDLFPGTQDAETDNFASVLKIKFKDGILYNSGYYDNKNSIYGFTIGEKSVFRIKYGVPNFLGTALENIGGSPTLEMKIAQYTLENGVYTLDSNNIYFEFAGLTYETEAGEICQYARGVSECLKSISYKDSLGKKIGIFIYDGATELLSAPLEEENFIQYFIEDIQFFKYVEDIYNENYSDNNKIIILPGATPSSGLLTRYCYFDPELPANEAAESLDEITYLYRDYEDTDNYVPEYDPNCEKIRSITAKESNRFNLLQTLSETFECRCKFIIKHNLETGAILLGKDIEGTNETEKYRQQKFVSFHEYINSNNYIGFTKGINLESTQRTIESEGFTTKIIVKDNTNKYATDGFCSIARAQDSPTLENYLYNFKYYINNGMLEETKLNKDLYAVAAEPSRGWIGYYTTLRNLNSSRDASIIEMDQISLALNKLESNLQVFSLAYDAAQEDLVKLKDDLVTSTGMVSNFDLINTIGSEDNTIWLAKDYIKTIYDNIIRRQGEANYYLELKTQYSNSIIEQTARYDELTNNLETWTEQKKEINKKFYSKYSRFIQEGTWTSNDYTDDTLYYYDSLSTLNASAFPKVSYTINVLELSQIEEFENYRFAVGDLTFIQDTDFFGWSYIDGIKTPYKEEVYLTEISYYLDDPTQNKIIVQNYKNDFQNLFQRITSATQSLQYHAGDYGLAAAAVTKTGEIKQDILQNSIANSSLILSNAKEQSVVWDMNGITITSLSKLNEVLRLVSGGIFVSKDGGLTWGTGISPSGINAKYITSGQIDASVVNIICGAFPAFKWDLNGITAYAVNAQVGEDRYFSLNKFVRFDQYGIYGFNNQLVSDFIPENEQDIIDSTIFSLTWSGFRLRSYHGATEGKISISANNDFELIDGSGNTRLKIGQINDGVYGIVIKDELQNEVLSQNSDGTLWLKNRLNIETEGILSVAIGKLGSAEGETKKQILNANNKFVVYEDGSIKATEGEISGTIAAASGSIGGILISEDRIYSAINAEDGLPTFSLNGTTGELIAKLGTIGGFSIGGGSLKSLALDTHGIPNITLDGAQGIISAKNVNLGTGVSVTDYLKFNNSYIYNPNGSRTGYINPTKLTAGTSFASIRPFIVSNNKVHIFDNGLIFLSDGNNTNDKGILIGASGVDSSMMIQSLSYFKSSGARGWTIRDNGDAVFRNINLSGSIISSVMEYQKIQTISGLVLLRPSSIIKSAVAAIPSIEIIDSINYFAYELTLENNNGFKNRNYAKINNSYYLMKVINGSDEGLTGVGSNTKKIIILSTVELSTTSLTSLIGKTVIDFGNGIQGNDIAIGLNASNNSGLINGRSLSIFEPYINSETSQWVKKDRIILGKIPNDFPDIIAGTYGLYADNVYLKGAIIAEGDQYTAGLNTNSSILETGVFGRDPDIFPNKEKGNIVLWAGSLDFTPEGIQSAPFRVDTFGNVFAGSAYFNGTIITNATITAAELRTASIVGDGLTRDSDCGLRIKDVANGIWFSSGEEDKFKLTAAGIQSFIPFQMYQGEVKTFEITPQGTLSLKEILIGSELNGINISSITNDISFSKRVPEGGSQSELINYPYFKFNDPGVRNSETGKYSSSLSINLDGEEYIRFIKNDDLEESISTVVNNNLKFEKEIHYGEIEIYKPAYDNEHNPIGYDLYIQLEN